jgi:GNAT superfamily N-acetyltransferase
MCDSVCEIKPIDAGNIGFLFSPCRECTYWEEVQDNTTGGTSIKQRRFATTLQSFGSCGFLLFLNGQAGGYVQYGYPSLFPNAAEYARWLFPPSPDTILLTCLFLLPGWQRRGFGVRLLQSVACDLQERGFISLETYARDDCANNCSGPTEFYLRHGFRRLQRGSWENFTFSLVRLELTRLNRGEGSRVWRSGNEPQSVEGGGVRNHELKWEPLSGQFLPVQRSCRELRPSNNLKEPSRTALEDCHTNPYSRLPG